MSSQVLRTLTPLRLLMGLIYLFLMAPLLVVIAVSFTTTRYLVFPPEGLTLDWYVTVFRDPSWTDSLLTSLQLAAASTVIATVVGVPAAAALARFRFRGRGTATSFVLSPLMVPSVVLAIGTLILYAQIDVDVPFWRLAFAHGVITAPFMIRTLSAGLARTNPALEEAAMNLGATRLVAWLRVVLPVARSALVAGMFLAFIVSFDELVVALFLSQVGLVTLPIRIYGQIEYSLDPSLAAVSALLILLTTVVVVVVARLGNLRQFVTGGG